VGWVELEDACIISVLKWNCWYFKMGVMDGDVSEGRVVNRRKARFDSSTQPWRSSTGR
jgi:hypothetical protein